MFDSWMIWAHNKREGYVSVPVEHAGSNEKLVAYIKEREASKYLESIDAMSAEPGTEGGQVAVKISFYVKIDNTLKRILLEKLSAHPAACDCLQRESLLSIDYDQINTLVTDAGNILEVTDWNALQILMRLDELRVSVTWPIDSERAVEIQSGAVAASVA